MKCLAMVLAALLVARVAWADIVRLDDGSTLSGTVKASGDGWDVTDANGAVTHVAKIHVKLIELTSRAPSGDNSLDYLASLRRAIESMSDIRQIIERLQKFIDQNANTPGAAEAAKDLEMWKDRQSRGMVKQGVHWVTVEERAKLQERAFAAVDAARRFLKESRAHDAETLVNEALADDPSNVSALYLRGLLQYRADQLPQARQSFEAVAKALPDHAPTLNNLGVIVWRQNQQIGALHWYEAAMLAAPGTREILDNVAEALSAMPKEQAKNPQVVKVQRRFDEQDAVLQQAMASAGLHRWGATWVNEKQLADLQVAEKENQRKLAQLSADFDATASQISKIETDIDENTRIMRRMDATSWGRDPQGNLFRLPLPSSYYTLQADNRDLAARRIELMRKLDLLRTAAKQVQQSLPTPRFSGLQRVIGPEGTPLQPPARPASQPAGRPG